MTEPKYTDDDFDAVDREALNRALQLTLAEDEHGRAEQLPSMRPNDGWWYAASFCASHRQYAALNLKPWQSPPCNVDEDNPRERDHNAVRVLKRMLAHCVSRWDPDPVAAIEATRTK